MIVHVYANFNKRPHTSTSVVTITEVSGRSQVTSFLPCKMYLERSTVFSRELKQETVLSHEQLPKVSFLPL